MRKGGVGSEGRFSRWSRLKKSGAKKEVPKNKDRQNKDVNSDELEEMLSDSSIASQDPSVVRVREVLNEKGFVQPMPPLAMPEDGETEYEAAPKDALAMVNLKVETDKDSSSEGLIEVEDDAKELTPEQAEAVQNLPPVETLNKDSDFTPFFKANVPDFLKRRAFKALWASSPFFNFRDGLDDYDENFRFIDKLISAANSDYKAGKGYGFDDEVEGSDDDLGDGEDQDEGHEGYQDEGHEGYKDKKNESSEKETITANDDNLSKSSEDKEEANLESGQRKSDVRPPEDAN
ncbi:MAG: DUF3306 domain-containing protein [Pseudomonadota bacterium]|nr:DUF3306 domain-containing protein [Pseudomonadota bacterium]